MATLCKKIRSEDQTVWNVEQCLPLCNLNVTVLYIDHTTPRESPWNYEVPDFGQGLCVGSGLSGTSSIQ